LFSVSKQYKQYFAGTVIDCSTRTPLDGVEVVAKDNTGHPLAVQTTGADGKYLLETAPGVSLQIVAGKAKYEQGALPLAGTTADTVLNKEICLAVIPEKKPDIFEGKKTLVTHNINFGFRKKDLTPDSYAYMDGVVAYLKENEAARLEIDAHTDGIGTTAFNLKLSQQRADACVDYLVKAGIARERLIAKGLGECCPLESEKTAKGKDDAAAREKNRRVEMKLLDK
jgi:outer membrane protein OmpA-like peptidoglycan-associated protein